MEELIKQAFLHVELIGPHVQAGHYDLIGPNGEIILPTVWERVIEPDWNVTMHMWPMEQRPPLNPGGMPRGGPPGMPRMPGHPTGVPLPGRRPGVGGGGGIPPGPPPPGYPDNMPFRPAHGPHMGVPGPPPGVTIVNAPKPKKASSRPKNTTTVFGSFFTGKPPKSKK